MARYHERYASDQDDHGIGDIARRNARSDYHEQFGNARRTQNPPEDYGTGGYPEPFDRSYRNEYEPYDERYGEGGGHALTRGYRGRGPKNYSRSDARLQEDISERLWIADDIDASDVTVEVQDGEVTLRGNVEQRRIRHRIEDIADACGGVKDIHNEIRVQPRNDWPHDKGAASRNNGVPATRKVGSGEDQGMMQSAGGNRPPHG